MAMVRVGKCFVEPGAVTLLRQVKDAVSAVPETPTAPAVSAAPPVTEVNTPGGSFQVNMGLEDAYKAIFGKASLPTEPAKA